MEQEPAPRVVVIGVDGLDPEVLEGLVGRGKVPNLARLHRKALHTTTPSDPLTAWASLITGVTPSVHGISGDSALPPVARVMGPPGADLSIAEPSSGPLGAEPVWDLLARASMKVRVLRGPLAFSASREPGLEVLAGQGTPDVGQGPCRWILISSTAIPAVPRPGISVTAVPNGDDRWTADVLLAGPAGETLAARLTLMVQTSTDGTPVLVVDGGRSKGTAPIGEWSGYFGIGFTLDGGRVDASTRMLPLQMEGGLKVFLEPPGVDPFSPSLPVSYPRYYAGFLADRYGTFRTCGVGVDATAFDAGLISGAALLRQSYASWEQQSRMTLGELTRPDFDVLVSIFPQIGAPLGTFSRAADPGSPAHDKQLQEAHGDCVEKMYGQLDSLVGEIMKVLRPGDRMMVVAPRGQRIVRRELSLTSWLVKEGYLVLQHKAKTSSRDGLADVDWSRTRAYSSGAGGVRLNLEGREPAGWVMPGEQADVLTGEIRGKLESLSEGSVPIVSEVLLGRDIFGDRQALAPDLVVVLAPGYGMSAASMDGRVPAAVLSDSSHPFVPAADAGDAASAAGVIMTLLPLFSEPTVLDVAPSVLAAVGLKPSPDMPGKSIW